MNRQTDDRQMNRQTDEQTDRLSDLMEKHKIYEMEENIRISGERNKDRYKWKKIEQ